MASWRIIEGDCVEAIAAMEECSVDAVVCDPPYGLGFMGKQWDTPGKSFVERKAETRNRFDHVGGNHNPSNAADAARTAASENRKAQEWHEQWAREALRVLKPGGHLLAFGGTRTYHRLACAVEDAGFEIRDTICWLYGSGFPKSLDVSKAIDKAAGAEREVVGKYVVPADSDAGNAGQVIRSIDADSMFGITAGREGTDITAPATPEAERWSGWGTALKPAHEPIVVARKPLVGTVAGNVLARSTGALNVDGCRVGTTKRVPGGISQEKPNAQVYGTYGIETGEESGHDPNVGRWPANVVLDGEAAHMLDAQTGELAAGNHPALRSGRGDEKVYGSGWSSGTDGDRRPTESGGASRFFYVAKASRAERNAGLDGFEEKMPHDNAGHVHADGRAWDVPGSHSTARANHHPTVKPIALMRWLVRLVTPPGGTVLDPFTGSGTTGCAAVLEGFDFIGCERDPEYVPIAKARIAWWAEHPEGQDVVAALDAEAKRQKVAATGQDDLFSSLTSKDETAPPSSSITAGNEAA